MLSCKDVSKLVSESLEHPLPFRKRMGVRMHLMMCSLCRRYQRQMLQLRALVKGAAASEPESGPLPEDVKIRIKKRLSDERH